MQRPRQYLVLATLSELAEQAARVVHCTDGAIKIYRKG